MKLREILLNFIPSKDIRIRLNNKQIKVNNEVVIDGNLELNITGEWLEMDEVKYLNGWWEFGDFLYYNVEALEGIPSRLFDLKDFFGEEPTNIKQLEFLTGYILISLSKREHYVFMIK